MRIFLILVSQTAMVAMMLIGGCASDPNQAARDARTAGIVQPMTIVGDWSVVAIERGGVERIPSKETDPSADGAKGGVPTINFAPTVGAAGGRFEVFTGVNRGAGRYNFTAGERDVGALGIERIALTRMAGPPDAMEFEAALLSALELTRTVTRISIQSGTQSGAGLVIDCGDTQIRLARHAAR